MYLLKLWLLFPMETRVTVLQCISPQWHTSIIKSRVFNLTEAELIYATFYFAVFFFLRELVFADRGKSAKSAEIRTRNIFMLPGYSKVAFVCSGYLQYHGWPPTIKNRHENKYVQFLLLFMQLLLLFQLI